MKGTLKALLVTTAVAAAVGVAPATANAAADWSCSSISGQYMYFQADTPLHSKPLGSSQVYAIFSTPQWINGSCVNKYGNQWWRTDYSSGYGYIYDGYRTG
ncbi:hypothetical protein OG948_38065 (plasmid) [Embleya sp. NBC_00888]|uniref:hypothetical protein n=1 Tax=Embleya sp. NBC_00888 TaxID=2975960 RepID=UPI002F90A1EF|nr:hypothetical protein OG948_38065 [Embleya sp. NBC_00888]